MRSRLCLPLQKATQQEVLQAIAWHDDEYDAFEVWLECMRDWDEAFLLRLAADLQDRLVIVFRRPGLEPMTIPLERRLGVLRLLHDSAVYIDLDISSQTAELAYIAKERLRLNTIVSYHDYVQTPGDAVLATLVRTMQAHKPTVLKLATHCRSEQDALRLLNMLLVLRGQDQRCIVLGMGEHGVATRIFGALWGNELAFVPPSSTQASAPGQLTRTQFETIITNLKG